MTQHAPKVVMYSTRFCPYCMRARSLLNKKEVVYEDIDVSDPALRDEMVEKSNRHSVPQIFIGDFHVGGYDDMAAMNRSGELDIQLKQQAE